MQPTAYSSPEARAMRRFIVFVLAFCAVLIFGSLLPSVHMRSHGVAAAQQPGNWHSGDCSDEKGHWGRAHVCQMRRTTFTLPSAHLSVETTNGGITVSGEDRPDVSLEARVTAWAPSQADAASLLNQVVIDTGNGDVRDHGPHSSFFGNSGYSVDYRLHVPRHLAADFHSSNGGIDLTSLDGEIRFSTTNGGVDLTQLSGDVQGHTVNGGLDIALVGDRWQGTGRIDMRIPDQYSAHLETSTVNGGISVDFPVTVQGEIKNHLSTDLGNGGPTVHIQTVNGGVSIAHGSAKPESSDED
jgi:hypothetical protein